MEDEDESQGSKLEEESTYKGPITRSRAKELQQKEQAFILENYEELAEREAWRNCIKSLDL